jgi:hypothetical protein
MAQGIRNLTTWKFMTRCIIKWEMGIRCSVMQWSSQLVYLSFYPDYRPFIFVSWPIVHICPRRWLWGMHLTHFLGPCFVSHTPLAISSLVLLSTCCLSISMVWSCLKVGKITPSPSYNNRNFSYLVIFYCFMFIEFQFLGKCSKFFFWTWHKWFLSSEKK